MIQVRDVPPELHEELVRRARQRGMTLTAYVQEILEREVARPTAEEWLERIQTREPIPGFGDWATGFIREMRDAGG